MTNYRTEIEALSQLVRGGDLDADARIGQLMDQAGAELPDLVGDFADQIRDGDVGDSIRERLGDTLFACAFPPEYVGELEKKFQAAAKGGPDEMQAAKEWALDLVHYERSGEAPEPKKTDLDYANEFVATTTLALGLGVDKNSLPEIGRGVENLAGALAARRDDAGRSLMDRKDAGKLASKTRDDLIAAKRGTPPDFPTVLLGTVSELSWLSPEKTRDHIAVLTKGNAGGVFDDRSPVNGGAVDVSAQQAPPGASKDPGQVKGRG